MLNQKIKNLNSIKGLTLIALIITIILMLIIAGAIINSAFGNNGLISIGKESIEDYKIASIKEKLELIKLRMYIEDESLADIDKYLSCLYKEKIKPYELTNIEKILIDTAIIEVDNKYVYKIKLDNDLQITYEGRVEEETNIKVELSGEVVQTTLPIKLNLEIDSNKNGKYVINKEEREIGKQEELYTETINKEEEEIEINEVGIYYIHILVTNKYGQIEEKIKEIINIDEEKHIHTGNSKSGGGCYTNPIYSMHTHNTGCVYWVTANIGQSIVCPIGHYIGTGWGANYKSYYCGTCYNNNNWICGKTTQQTIQGYSLSCGKSENDIIYKVKY